MRLLSLLLLTLLALPVAAQYDLVVGATYEDQGLTSDVHRSHVGQVVFSTEPIAFRCENPDQFATSFGPYDPIYARHYLPASVWNLTDDQTELWYTFVFVVDGEEVHGRPSERCHDECVATLTTWQMNLDENESYTNDKLKTAWKSLIESGYTTRAATEARQATVIPLDGTHEIEVQVRVYSDEEYGGQVVASGTFTYDAKG